MPSMSDAAMQEARDEYDRLRDEAAAAMRTSIRDLHEQYGGISFQAGSFFDQFQHEMHEEMRR